MALTNLNNTPLITQSKTKPTNFTIFSSIKNKNGETIVVGFTFEYNYKNKKDRFIVNKIDTIFGMDINIEQGYYTHFENANYKVVYKKGSGWLAPIAPTSTSINNSISGNEENINIKYSKFLDSAKNKLTEQQSKFFENSMVRDDKGNLLVVYHSTNADFTVFENKYKGSNIQWIDTNLGFFFSPNKEITKQFGYKTKEYYLNILKPLDLRKFIEQSWDDNAEFTNEDNILLNDLSSAFETTKEELIEASYDPDNNVEELIA